MSEVVLKPVLLAPGEGRVYEFDQAGRLVFKVDDGETAGRYSVMEVWMEPNIVPPPGTNEPNAHPQDHVFYVIAGTLSAQINGEWSHMPKGSFLFLPGGTSHHLENRGADPTGYISFNSPGGIEARMPEIAAAVAARMEKTASAR